MAHYEVTFFKRIFKVAYFLLTCLTTWIQIAVSDYQIIYLV